MFALVLWKLIDAWKGHQEEDDDKKKWAQRGFDVLKAVLYAVIGVAAVRQATGGSSSGSSGKSGTESLTAQIMDLPGGQVLVGLVGFAIIGYGANQIRIAYTDKFREKINAGGTSGQSGRAYYYFGKVGYTAKGIAIIIVGGLFVYAAFTHKRREVRRARRGAAHRPRAALRPVPARHHGRRPRLLRALLLRAGAAPRALIRPGTTPPPRRRRPARAW